MENEIMNNEVVIEEVTEIAEGNSKTGLILLGVSAAALVGVFLYKKVIKPAYEKRKAEKEAAKELKVEFEESFVEVNDSEEN